jgi:uncharacterized membrane protein
MTRFSTVAVTAIGFGFSCYLTYRELFSIHAICEWCVSSAAIMTVLVSVAVSRFLLGDRRPGDGAATAGSRSDAGSSLGALPS